MSPRKLRASDAGVATWQHIVDSAPEFAATLRRHLDARAHKTIATLRVDGSPRISGIETFFADGELWFGSMPNARKALDRAAIPVSPSTAAPSNLPSGTATPRSPGKC